MYRLEVTQPNGAIHLTREYEPKKAHMKMWLYRRTNPENQYRIVRSG